MELKENYNRVSDALKEHWVYRFLPQGLWPHAQLARWDRPIGWYLLFWPCIWSLSLAMLSFQHVQDFTDSFSLFFKNVLLFLIGSILMRGAGCTYNDLVDEPIDCKVHRTQSRPLPAQRVTRLQARIFLMLQLILSFGVLIQFNKVTFLLGLIPLPLILLYPFMKRISNWPQSLLALCFSWGALMGWSSVFNSINAASVLLYCGCLFWVIGYDTIYAHQDKEDDALLGMGSTALIFGEKTKLWLSLLYGLAFFFIVCALSVVKTPLAGFVGAFAGGVHMARQIYTLNIDDPDNCLKIFRSNSIAGLIIFLGLLLSIFMKASMTG